jgi:hypothetical protein
MGAWRSNVRTHMSCRTHPRMVAREAMTSVVQIRQGNPGSSLGTSPGSQCRAAGREHPGQAAKSTTEPGGWVAAWPPDGASPAEPFARAKGLSFAPVRLVSGASVWPPSSLTGRGS